MLIFVFTVRSVVLDTKTILKQKIGQGAEVYYKIFTNSDVIESLDENLQISSSGQTPIRFNPISYQLYEL